MPLIDYLTALASNQDWTDYCEETEQIEQIEQTNNSIDEILDQDQQDYVYEDEIEDDLIRFDEPE